MAESKSKAETIVLRLEDKISGAADAAEGALARLEARIAREHGALGRLEGDLTRAKGALRGIAGGGEKGAVDISAYRKQAAAVQALTDKIANQKDRIAGLQDKANKPPPVPGLAKPADKKKDVSALNEVGNAATLLGGRFGHATARATTFGESLGKLPPVAAAVAAALVATTIVVAGVIAGFAKAIAAADEYRDKTLDLASAGVTLWNAQRSSQYQAEQFAKTIDDVASRSAIARDEVAGFAKEIRDSLFFGGAIFKGKEQAKVLETMSMVAAGGSKTLAHQYLEQARMSKFLGTSLDALNERMKLKFGAVAQARLLSLGVQMQKLKENIFYIFSGADVEPFLKGLQSILSLLDRNEESGKSLRDTVTKLTEAAIGGFLEVAIALVETYIWLKEHEKQWGLVKDIVVGFGVALLVISAVIVGAIGLITIGVVFAVGLIMTVVKKVGEFLGDLAFGIVTLVVGMVKLFVDGIKELGEKLGDAAFKFVNLGKGMVDGIVEGIKAAPGKIFDALKSVVSGAVKGIEDFLGIHSPSQLLHDRIGFQMGAGVAGGIEESGDEIKGAAKQTFGVVTKEMPSTPSSAPSGGHTVTFQGCNFGENSEAALRKAVVTFLEEATMDAGVPT